MAEISRPDFTYQWSSTGAITAPSTAKIQAGWTAEVPPFQWENWSQNRQDNAISYVFQKGIGLWSATQDYYYIASGRAFVQGSDGFIYEAVQSSTGQNPTTDTTNTYWRRAFTNQSGTPLYAVDTGTANAYKADYVPVVKTLVDGMVLKFKAANTNTTNSTFTPANGVIAPSNIVGGSFNPLQGGEIVAGSEVWLQWSASLSGWLIVGGTTNSLQVANATQSHHAVAYGQLATTTLVGLTQLATNGQMAIGTSTSLVPSVAAVMSLFSKRVFTNSDSIRIPDVPGGLIYQWGPIINAASAAKTETLSQAYPTAHLAIVLTGLQGTGATQAYSTLNSKTLSTFTWTGFAAASGSAPVISPTVGAVQGFYISIGY